MLWYLHFLYQCWSEAQSLFLDLVWLDLTFRKMVRSFLLKVIPADRFTSKSMAFLNLAISNFFFRLCFYVKLVNKSWVPLFLPSSHHLVQAPITSQLFYIFHLAPRILPKMQATLFCQNPLMASLFLHGKNSAVLPCVEGHLTIFCPTNALTHHPLILPILYPPTKTDHLPLVGISITFSFPRMPFLPHSPCFKTLLIS